MGRDVNVDFKELVKFRDKLERLSQGTEKEMFMVSCANELAARLLAKVIKRTPVGDYSDTYDLEDDGEQKFLVMSDKEGGTLRKAWKAGVIRKEGSNYVIEVSNEEHYAPYVEFGHRQTPGRYVPAIGKQLKQSFVRGHFMLTLSTKEIRDAAPGILEKKLNAWFREVFSDD